MGTWKVDLKVQEKRGFPCCPAVRTLCFHCQGSKFNPWLGGGGTKILQANQHSSLPPKRKKRKKTEETSLCFGENPKISHHILSPSPGRFCSPIPLLDLYQINLSFTIAPSYCHENSFPNYLLCRKGYHSTLHTPPSLTPFPFVVRNTG